LSRAKQECIMMFRPNPYGMVCGLFHHLLN
jgi:hypothetical protein